MLVSPLLKVISHREIEEFREELNMPDRRALDDLILDHLDIPPSLREQLYKETLRLIESRQNKARSVSKRRPRPHL